MKILIAPDSFKESMSADEAGAAIEKGFREIFPEAHYIRIPMADGGEGTTDAVIAATHGRRIFASVHDPLGRPLRASYVLTGDGKSAIIETAAASGLALVKPHERNPLRTTSYGTGELILDSLRYGIRHLVLGLGGSATNDCGVGILNALGVRFKDREGNEFDARCGNDLASLASLDTTGMDPRLKDLRIDVACDVDNPLCGSRGASAVFGPQKGASPEMVAVLDANLSHFAKLCEEMLGISMDVAGAGAAGGIGGAVYGFLNGRMRSGFEIVAEVNGLEEHIRDADLVLTGEGKIDGQSVHGKTPVGVARLAKKYAKPVIAIGGMLGDDAHAVYGAGIDALFSCTRRLGALEDMLRNGAANLECAAGDIARALRTARNLPF